MTPAAWSSSNVVSGAAKFLPSHSLNSRLDCFVKPTVSSSLRSPRKSTLKALAPSCGAHSCATARARVVQLGRLVLGGRREEAPVVVPGDVLRGARRARGEPPGPARPRVSRAHKGSPGALPPAARAPHLDERAKAVDGRARHAALDVPDLDAGVLAHGREHAVRDGVPGQQRDGLAVARERRLQRAAAAAERGAGRARARPSVVRGRGSARTVASSRFSVRPPSGMLHSLTVVSSLPVASRLSLKGLQAAGVAADRRTQRFGVAGHCGAHQVSYTAAEWPLIVG